MSTNLDKWLQISPGLERVRNEVYAGNSDGLVLPPRDLVFTALNEVSPTEVEVVVLGQDPYHKPGKACGRAFGYHPDYRGPVDSSLDNILREVENSGYSRPRDISLAGWARQDVLLINTRLTVGSGRPMSHANKGWENCIGEMLRYLGSRDRPLVWMVWGSEAQNAYYKSVDIPNEEHMVLAASHPCRYSVGAGRRPFHNSQHFKLCNEFLTSQGLTPIDWSK